MKKYEELLKDYLAYQAENPFQGKPDELYDPTNYILGLGGKRIRPLLVLLGYQLIDDQTSRALPLAHAIEVFHNFTLMHDDIMDHAEVRRGKPTVHTKWNENIAILSGDLMLVKAYRLLADLDANPEIQIQIIQAFGKMAEEVCIGQQLDMNFEVLDDVPEEDYMEMIKLKTSVLLAHSLSAGVLLGGGSTTIAKSLYDYGLDIGLAFQIMDDYLDTFGDQESFGKRIGGDILENKKTLLWIEATKRCNPEQKRMLNKCYSTVEESQEKIDAVTSLFSDLGVDQFAKEKMGYFLGRAESNLNELSSEIDVSPLRDLTNRLQQRQS